MKGLVGEFERDLGRFVLPERADFLGCGAWFFGEGFDVSGENPKG